MPESAVHGNGSNPAPAFAPIVTLSGVQQDYSAPHESLRRRPCAITSMPLSASAPSFPCVAPRLAWGGVELRLGFASLRLIGFSGSMFTHSRRSSCGGTSGWVTSLRGGGIDGHARSCLRFFNRLSKRQKASVIYSRLIPEQVYCIIIVSHRFCNIFTIRKVVG